MARKILGIDPGKNGGFVVDGIETRPIYSTRRVEESTEGMGNQNEKEGGVTMCESFNYIEVLCRVGSATMTASWDWAQSIRSVKKYADMLAALDYNIMFAEAQQPNAKKTLEGWSSWEIRCWSLCWLIRNAKQMYKWLEKLLCNDFREIAEAQKEKGTWTFDEWRDYRVMCDDTLYQWQERLNELLSAYGYEAGDSDGEASDTGT